ncbi:MAG TPA: phosphate acyltransferase PlsX [Phycisphaerae bacterium]|nr:phosphate acyltransferase PlsX [Phycisphaerae bacterium]
MRIGIDAMGGDGAPAMCVAGAVLSRDLLADGDRIVLVGDESAIHEHLPAGAEWEDIIEVYHASEVISMGESPIEALRGKPDSSMAVLAELHKRGKVDAMISAGNTGACVAAAQMRLRRLDAIYRPGITILTPTYRGPVAISDVGANVNCRPQHLQQYAIMSSEYLAGMCGIENPRVGLLSIGEEDAKGNSLVKNTRELIKDDSRINFIGNIEGRDLFSGVCDVMICEGFVGNVVLKLIEGMSIGVIQGMLKEMAAAMPDQAANIARSGKSVMGKYDFNEYGGAPLLGVAGICIICHGASNERGIMNAVRGAKEFSSHQINQRIVKLVSEG